ncbi:VrrA/YqfQ family protein [Gottfriedia luciferensis]|uniref:VrrA/YqfQ family protein n=1 Tax=Gottfriedia luciferensis TaxID=178774 RepID=UPI000B454ADF|nr:VrrA/YqfQ family protein [Gottfriedia luciferensis]
MGLLDKFKKKNKQPFPMNGPNYFNGYQQGYQNMHNPYGMRPNFGQQVPYPHSPQLPFQQNGYQPTQQFAGNQGYYQQPVAYQPQLNAHQQYVNQNKILQSIPFQNQPVMQSHNSSNYQQQSFQNQFPMTGQPPEKEESDNPGFFSRLMGGDTSITGVIGGMQKAVQAAQQVTPMIQQYAPAVKNFPSLYKIFKAVNTDDPAETKKSKKESNEVIELTPAESTTPKRRKKVKLNTEQESIPEPKEPERNLNPRPKLFM